MKWIQCNSEGFQHPSGGKQACRNARLFSFPERRNKLVRQRTLSARREGEKVEIHTAVHLLPRREGNKSKARSVQSGNSGEMNIIRIENPLENRLKNHRKITEKNIFQKNHMLRNTIYCAIIRLNVAYFAFLLIYENKNRLPLSPPHTQKSLIYQAFLFSITEKSPKNYILSRIRTARSSSRG